MRMIRATDTDENQNRGIFVVCLNVTDQFDAVRTLNLLNIG